LTLPASLALLLFAAIIAKVRTFYDNLVPLGYQDEDGFHKGEKH